MKKLNEVEIGKQFFERENQSGTVSYNVPINVKTFLQSVC